jgi:hypothetical protein
VDYCLFYLCLLSVSLCFLAVLSPLSSFLMFFLSFLRMQSVLCYPDSSHSQSHTQGASNLPCYSNTSLLTLVLNFNWKCLCNHIFCF